jgi:hypothetical protein
MLLRIVENGAFRDVHIKEGEMFMLPGKSIQDQVTMQERAYAVAHTALRRAGMTLKPLLTFLNEDPFHYTGLACYSAYCQVPASRLPLQGMYRTTRFDTQTRPGL